MLTGLRAASRFCRRYHASLPSLVTTRSQEQKDWSPVRPVTLACGVFAIAAVHDRGPVRNAPPPVFVADESQESGERQLTAAQTSSLRALFLEIDPNTASPGQLSARTPTGELNGRRSTAGYARARWRSYYHCLSQFAASLTHTPCI